MKQIEIKGSKSHSTRSTTAKPHYSTEELPRFNFLNPRKHIFKNRHKPHQKRIPPAPVEPAQNDSNQSNQHLKTITLPSLETKSGESQIQFFKSIDLEVVEERIEPSPCREVAQPGMGGNSVESVKMQAGDTLPYIPSISEHLLRQQARHPMPLLLQGENCPQDQRMNYLHLIFAFCLRYGFKVETIFLAFSIYHRIAFTPDFQKYSHSLKAAAALFVAAKYQEIAIPKVQFFTRFDPSSKLSSLQLLRLQSQILLHLNFNLSFPTVLQFIDIIRLHHNLDRSFRDRLVNVCYSSLRSLALWQERGSLLALACVNLMRPDLELGQSKSEELNGEMKWRVAELVRLGAAEWI